MNTLEIRKTNGKIYSFIRQKDLVCTPEEEVRQNFICKLVNDFGSGSMMTLLSSN